MGCFCRVIWKVRETSSTQSWLYSRRMRLCYFFRKFRFRSRFCLCLTINACKSLAIRVQKNVCWISVFTEIPAAVASIVVFILPTAFYAGSSCTCLAIFDIFGFQTHSTQKFLPSIHSCLTVCHLWRLWELPCAIRLKKGEESISIFWFVQTTANSFRCFFGDWATFRGRTRLLSNFHRSLSIFTSLNRALHSVRDSLEIFY